MIRLGERMVTISISPIRTPNPLNGTHGHWAKKAKLRKAQRSMSYLPTCFEVQALKRAGTEPLPCTVVVTRLAPSNGLDPHDGLGAALKGIIDGVADALGLKSDRDPRVTWQLAQERSKDYAVRIEIRRRP